MTAEGNPRRREHSDEILQGKTLGRQNQNDKVARQPIIVHTEWGEFEAKALF
jgi:hypothetical protein